MKSYIAYRGLSKKLLVFYQFPLAALLWLWDRRGRDSKGAALTQKIARLVDSAQERTRIARNGMKLVRESYNWDRFADQIDALCKRTQV